MRRAYDLDSNAWVRRAALTSSNEILPGEITPKPGVWSGPPAPLPRFHRTPLYAILGFIVAVRLAIDYFGIAPPFFFIAMFPVALFFVYGVAGSPGANKKDLRLLEDLDDADVCLVSVSIYRGRTVIGSDRGAAWFSDGRLMFNGHRTSFVLGGQDLLSPGEWPQWGLSKKGEPLPDGLIALRHPEVEAFVRIAPLPRRGDSNTAAEMRFRKRLYDFRRHTPFAASLRQWPPLEA